MLEGRSIMAVDKTKIDTALENPEIEVEHDNHRTKYAGAEDLIKRREYLDSLATKSVARGKPKIRYFKYKSGLFNR